jgi:C4-type Zn-finger protein
LPELHAARLERERKNERKKEKNERKKERKKEQKEGGKLIFLALDDSRGAAFVRWPCARDESPNQA